MLTKTKIKSIKPNIFNKIYFCFFLLLPFVYSGEIIDPVLIPRQIYLTLFIFLVGLIICYKIHEKKLITDFSFLKLSLPLLFLAFLIINIISFTQSIAITESIYVLSKVMIEILFFVITTYLIIQKKLDIEYLIKSIIIFSIISVVITIYQILALYFSENTFFSSVSMIKSTFANKNLLSSILFLTFPFLFCSFNFSKRWKFLSLILYLIILILLWLIQTKAVIIAFFLFFFIFFLFYVRNRKSITKKLFLKLIFVTSVSIIIFSIFISKQNSQEFSHLTNKHSATSRFLLWENSVYMIKDNWVFGVGAGNWQIHFPKYGLNNLDAEERMGIITYQRPHNDFLWVFCEMGIIGILAYISIFIIILYYLFKLIQKFKEREDNWLYSSFFAAIIGYLIIAFVDFPLERIEHQILLYLIFSVITANYYNEITICKPAKNTIVKLSLSIILLFLSVLFSLFVSISRYSGEYHTHKLYNAHKKANWDLMIKEADKAINFCYFMDPMSAPIEWYKGVALFSSGNISVAKTCFEQAYSIHPYNIHVLNNLASCYETLKEHKKAEEFYLKALSISSEFEEARLNLSAVYYNIGDYEKAFEMIDKCSINSTDIKYQSFLPVILDSKIDEILKKQKDTIIIKKIIKIKNTKDKILKSYLDSKRNKINFAEYLIKM